MKISTILLCALLISFNSFAQISTNETPPSFKEEVEKKVIPVITLPALNYEIIQKEDFIDSLNGLPPRFGYDFDVDISVKNSGVWTDLPNKKGSLWQLEIYCPGALSINLLYDEFYIPEGGKFFIYSSDKKKKLGAFTQRNNKGIKTQPGAFATSLVLDEKIVLEYFKPHKSNEIPVISIAKVVHGYRQIKSPKFFDDSGDCNVNINCSEGAAWQNEKTSVALIVVDGTRWCTGSLINNTKGDGAPFLLTANHCLGVSGLDAITNPTASTWTFLWNYESPTCENGANFTPPSTAGATVIANNSSSDFALLELDETPFDLSPSLCLYYNGWDKSGSTPLNTTCIHHPSGDIKKISVDNDSPSLNRNFWRVNDWDIGTTEGGSSGSPLFDSNHNVVGQLLGGAAACGNDLHDDFGKFSISWNNSLDQRRRLKDWLDPLGTNVNNLDGAYLFPANKFSISGPKTVMDEATYSIVNLPDGATVHWSASNENLELISGQGTDAATFQSKYFGDCTINATIIACGSVTIRYNVSADFDLDDVYIDGPEFVCDNTATFTVRNLLQSSTVSFDHGSFMADSVYTVFISSYSDSPGVAKVLAEAKYLGKKIEMEHLFSFNKPGFHYVEDTVIYDYGFYYDQYSGLGSVGVEYSYPANGINYEWSCNNNWQLVYGGTDYAEFEGPLTGSILEVKLCFDNPCGARTCLIRELYLPESLYSLVFSPNPVSNETTVSIKPSAGAKSFDENAEWDLEVYGANQNLQEKKPKLRGSTATLQTAGWKEGVYLVRAVYKDEILTGKLVVKR